MMTEDCREKAVVFVDFEYWYYSLKNNFAMTPNIRMWRDNVTANFNVLEMMFFADFSQKCLASEILKIREATNLIIETQDTYGTSKKDYTDFIMLDAIYQKAFALTAASTFILFTGDGHFSSVAGFLKNRCCKQVGIYGIRGSISRQLKNICHWLVELPNDAEELFMACVKIFESLKSLDRRSSTYGKTTRPTFWKTIETVSEYNDLDIGIVENAMRHLMSYGYIYSQTEILSKNNTIKVLKVDWELARKDGFCDYEPDEYYYSQSFNKLKLLTAEKNKSQGF